MDVKGNKESFCKYISGKRKTKEHEDLLLNGAGNLVMRTWKKALVLNVFFAPAFARKSSLQESQASETRGKGWSKEGVILVEEGQVRLYLT